MCKGYCEGCWLSVFSVSFWNPRNPTRETLVIPLEGYEAPLQVSFGPLRRLKVTEVTRVLRTEPENTAGYLVSVRPVFDPMILLFTREMYVWVQGIVDSRGWDWRAMKS